MLTLWALWIKPGLRIRYRDINHYVEHGRDAAGRVQLQIIDEHYNYYWTRLDARQYALFKRRAPAMRFTAAEPEQAGGRG